jgi:hypothetical protein
MWTNVHHKTQTLDVMGLCICDDNNPIIDPNPIIMNNRGIINQHLLEKDGILNPQGVGKG